MKRYGDVVMLDGTQMNQANLGWDVFPVTLIDNDKHLICGGVLFLGLQTANVFKWILETLNRFLGEMWQTLLTDEDSALMSAIPEFCETVRPISHRTCVFHKFKNMVKHVNRLRCTEQNRETLRGLVKDVCFGDDEREVNDALDKIGLSRVCSITLINTSSRFSSISHHVIKEKLSPWGIRLQVQPRA
jgi:hypothetical protein